MNGKEKLLQALRHTEGPIPLDFGATAVTGIHCSIVADLRAIYGLEKRPVKVIELYQMLGEVDEELREAMGVDTIGISGRNTMFGFPLEQWKEWRTPWGQEVLVPVNFEVDEIDGDVFIYPQGDRSAAPSGKMPEGSCYFDALIRQQPFEEDSLNVEDNLEEFKHISEEDLKHFESKVTHYKHSGKGVAANFGGTAIGDIALIPGLGLKHPKGIRDITEWYISTVTRQDFIHHIFDAQITIAVENLKRIFERVGNAIDVIFICGTDFGTQVSQFCSVETFRSLYYPYYKRVNDWIHANTAWKTFKHTCGAVEPFIGSFIDAGFDILNPVQCSAAGMDPEYLKNTYGEKIVFWGGGIDTQKTLPFGTPAEVRKEVTERLDIFSKNGGYIFNTIHNLQAGTPIKNIEAMLDAFHTFNEGR
ncbi:MAG: uroporphyrinogen decarboxylase family protein [Sphaerochaetaceae bacterium]